MKLKEWAEKAGVKYLTAYRWFKTGMLPVKAYQTGSGTIIVEEELESEKQEKELTNNNTISLFLKKTVEFSKNEGTIEDFAAWVLTNFTLKSKETLDFPKYSKNMPKPEQIQEHFKQFLKPKGEKPKPNMLVAEDMYQLDDLFSKSDDLTTKELVEEINKVGTEVGVSVNTTETPEIKELIKDLSSAFINQNTLNSHTYDSLTEGIVTRSVDLTPQSLNYTEPSNCAFGRSIQNLNNSNNDQPILNTNFQPTSKEIEAANLISKVAFEKPHRVRKSLKNQGTK